MRIVARRWGRRILMLVLSGAAAAPASSLASVLAPGTEHTHLLAIGQNDHYRVHLGRGQSAELSLLQLDATLQLRLSKAGGAATPLFQDDAGRNARLRITLYADATTDWRIDIGAKDPTSPASYRISLTGPHATTRADRERAAAEQSLAQAENLRRATGSSETNHQASADAEAQAHTEFEAAINHARAATDACLLLMAHADLARLQYAAGNYAAAAESAKSALRFRCGKDSDASAAAERAVAERTLGSALGYVGDLIAGTNAQERALALYRQTGDAHFQAMALGNLSADYRVLGETQKALDVAHAALRLAEASGDRKRALFVRESIAAIHLQRGELALARDGYRQTIADLAITPDPMIAGMAWNDLGTLDGELGDYAESSQAYRQAETAWQDSGDQDGLTETRLNEADSALRDGDIDSARGLFDSALAYYDKHDRQRERAHALAGLGRCAMARRDWKEASRQLLASRDVAHKAGAAALEAAAYLALGDLDLRRKNLPEGEHNYQRAYALSVASRDLSGRAAALAGRAHAAELSGDLTAARGLIERTLTLVEDQRAQITEPALATNYFSTQRGYYERAIDVLMQLDRRDPGKGYAALALETSERARARSLQELLAQRTIRVATGLDPALLDAERADEDRLRRIAWRQAQLPAAAPPAARDALAIQLDDASHAVDDARGRIRAASPRYAELAHPAPLTSTAIEGLLDADVVVLEYWLGDENSYLWAVADHSVSAWTLPARASIDVLSRDLRTALVAPATTPVDLSMEALAARQRESISATDALARSLDQMVLAPVGRELRKPTIVVVADGSLERLPFGVLDDASRSATEATPSAVTTFVYLPSVGTLRALRKMKRPASAQKDFAIFADPVFRPDDPRIHSHEIASSQSAAADQQLLRAASEADVATLPSLPHARDEAHEIAVLAAPRPVWQALDFDASRAAVETADWSSYALVHFATHAMLNSRHPELSGIVLSLYDKNGHAEDGFLRMNDIYNLHMPVDLVVLSACDSALGKTMGPEGMFSLSRAFFYAGVRRVVASLWPVDDRASAAFMKLFYEALLQHHRAPQAAIADAQAGMQRDARWRQPFYWAGFVVQGDWR